MIDMDRRLLLAVVLMTAVILITNILFPPPPPEAVEETATTESVAVPRAGAQVAALPAGVTQAPIDTITVESPLYRFEISTQGGTFVGAELLRFASYSAEGERVQLVAENSSGLFINRLVTGGDTLDLRSFSFSTSRKNVTVADSVETVEFVYGDPTGFSVTLTYRFRPDSYLVDVAGGVTGVSTGDAYLVTNLGPGLGIHEHPDHRSETQFAAVSRSKSGVSRLMFRSIKEDRALPDSLTWAGIKDKYFLAAAIAGDGPPLRGNRVLDVPDGSRRIEEGKDPIVLPQAVVSVGVPINPDGVFQFGAYMGPQDYAGLSAIGYDLQQVTPYGYRWLEPIIRPLAAAVMWILSNLHNTLGIAYGWVLLIFGVGMRIVTWPLNARAMRAQMKNMEFQPLVMEIKQKYANDPQKQQEAMLALYKEKGFNPFSGCLPMLIPFPVLITLFFVFQNTIAFRGAQFLWLPDLSLRDPYNILPIILMVSMFGLQWVSTYVSGMEQNPQAKMMMYTMPIMMGIFFFLMPSGLNLYYSSTQIASIPQQVLIAKERRAATEALKAKNAGGPTPLAGGPPRKPAPKRKR